MVFIGLGLIGFDLVWFTVDCFGLDWNPILVCSELALTSGWDTLLLLDLMRQKKMKEGQEKRVEEYTSVGQY